ncbi:iron-sulfur cluster assembly 1 homolog, mitochondrial-like [Oncorhynchus masou masou]|uniref:iron-sulfur cluster assembly 1 homolog, mitochondrial-like n=1 Tax=Oncorhynchus masou masou TaxID=90313 RepID=UPI003183C86B
MSASMVARATVRAVSKRKILATRAALTLTPPAVNRIRTLLENKPEYIGLKVGVRTRGCNGMTYTLDFTKQKDQADEEVLQDGEQLYRLPSLSLKCFAQNDVCKLVVCR